MALASCHCPRAHLHVAGPLSRVLRRWGKAWRQGPWWGHGRGIKFPDPGTPACLAFQLGRIHRFYKISRVSFRKAPGSCSLVSPVMFHRCSPTGKEGSVANWPSAEKAVMRCCCFHLKRSHRWAWTEGSSFPGVILRIWGVSAGIIHSCSSFLLGHFPPVSFAWESGWFPKLQRLTLEKASGYSFPAIHQAGQHYMWVPGLVHWYTSSFSSQQLWQLCIFIIPHLTHEDSEAQIGYLLWPSLHSLNVKLRVVFKECSGPLG